VIPAIVDLSIEAAVALEQLRFSLAKRLAREALTQLSRFGKKSE